MCARNAGLVAPPSASRNRGYQPTTPPRPRSRAGEVGDDDERGWPLAHRWAHGRNQGGWALDGRSNGRSPIAPRDGRSEPPGQKCPHCQWKARRFQPPAASPFRSGGAGLTLTRAPPSSGSIPPATYTEPREHAKKQKNKKKPRDADSFSFSSPTLPALRRPSGPSQLETMKRTHVFSAA